MSFIDKTRWDVIDEEKKRYRLLCNNETCSLSSANLINGKLSITATHGQDRHTYLLGKNEMALVALEFLDSLNEKELLYFTKLFAKRSENFLINLEKI